MTVGELMTKDVSTCRAGTNLCAVAELMWCKDIGSVPVVEADGRVLGIITDRDMSIALGTRNVTPAMLTARDAMTSPARTCSPQDDVRAALGLMRDSNIRRLPVVDREGKLQGIVSLSDLILNVRYEGGRKCLSFGDIVRAMQVLSANRARRRVQAAA